MKIRFAGQMDSLSRPHPGFLLREKLNGRSGQPAHRGILLVECMVYIAVFFMIMAVASKLFYCCWDSAKMFRRNTEQIAATLKVGERWREDVRSASAAIRTETSGDETLVRIPQSVGEVDYRFAEAALWRRNGAEGEWTKVLPEIKSSRMDADQRGAFTAWRWELELITHRKGARVVPLFTFEAVPNSSIKP